MYVWQYLVDYIDSVVQLLPLQDGVQVVEPVLEMLLSFPEGNDNGHLLERHTLSWLKSPTLLNSRVHLLHLIQTDWEVKIHSQRPHWGHMAPFRQRLSNQSKHHLSLNVFVGFQNLIMSGFWFLNFIVPVGQKGASLFRSVYKRSVLDWFIHEYASNAN